MSDFQVTGANDFYRLSKALKAAGRTGLRKEMNKALREATKPLIVKTREAARKDLPHRGGLANSVAKAPQRVQVRTGARTAGVRIVASGPVKGANAGKIRHPVFGDRSRFVEQTVPGGWFDETLSASAADVEPALIEAMNQIIDKVVGEAKHG